MLKFFSVNGKPLEPFRFPNVFPLVHIPVFILKIKLVVTIAGRYAAPLCQLII